MLISSSVDPSKELTIFTASGVLSFEEQHAAFKNFYEGKPTKKVILDLRAITGRRISSEGLPWKIRALRSMDDAVKWLTEE